MKYIIVAMLVIVFGLIVLRADNFQIKDPFGDYTKVVHKTIDQHWSYSEDSAHHKAVVHFFISRDGKLDSIPMVSETSGDSSYDALALRAVYDSSPFPPPPNNENKFEVFFEFSPKR